MNYNLLKNGQQCQSLMKTTQKMQQKTKKEGIQTFQDFLATTTVLNNSQIVNLGFLNPMNNNRIRKENQSIESRARRKEEAKEQQEDA